MKLSQWAMVLDHLQSIGPITTFECYQEYGFVDLQASIMKLRKDGFNIKDKWIEKTNRYGNKTRYKKYFLEGKI